MPESKSWMQHAIDNARIDCHFAGIELRDFIRSVKRKIKKASRTDGGELARLQADLAEFEKGLQDCVDYAQRAIDLEAKLRRRASSKKSGDRSAASADLSTAVA